MIAQVTKNPLIKLLTLWVLVFLPSLESHATETLQGNPIFKHFTIEDGLPSSTITVIFQSKSGVMWLGTRSGLTRFDGYTFTNYHSNIGNKGVTHPWVTGITEDDQNNIWVATRNGLNRLNPQTERFQHFFHDEENPHSISHNIIYGIHKSIQGELWIATSDGLNRYITETKGFERFTSPFGDDPNTIKALTQSDVNTLWLGTHRSGLFRFDLDNKIFEKVDLSVNNAYPKTKHVYSLALDKKNRLWMATDAGLVEYNIKTKQSKRHVPENNSQDTFRVYFDQSDRLWVSNLDDSVCHFQPDSGQWECLSDMMPPTPAKEVESIYQDKSGIFWIGMNSEGLLVFKPKHPFRTFQFETPYNNTSLINIDSSRRLWAISPAGIVSIDENNRVRKLSNDKIQKSTSHPEVINEIHISRDNKVWLATASGVSLLNPIDFRVSSFEILNSETLEPIRSIMSITQTTPDQLLLSSFSQGLFHWNPNHTYAKPVKFDSNAPKGIELYLNKAFLDSKGRFWSFGLRGISYYNQTTKQLTVTEYIYSEQVFFLEMAEDENKQLWLISYRGLYQINENGKIVTQYDKKNFGNSILQSITSSANHLWIGTSNGLWRFNPKSLEIQQYTQKDGLPSNGFNLGNHVDSKGNIYMGSAKGIVVFHPDRVLNMPSHQPRTLLTELRINNQPVEVTADTQKSPLSMNLPYLNHLTLDYEQGQFFSIEFSALDYFTPGNTQFAYKLDGLNDDWIYTDANNRRAIYTTLAPGNYTFRTKASDSSSVWQQDDTHIEITVLPPWWRTLWAYALYVTIFFISLFSFVHYRTMKAKQKAKQLEQEVKLRTEEINSQKETIQSLLDKKNTLFENVSHELRTPLTLILGPTERLLQSDQKDSAIHDLDLIKRNGQRLQGLVEQLLFFSKLSHHESLDSKLCRTDRIAETTIASLKSMIDEQGLTLHLENTSNLWVRVAPEDTIQTILSNLLSNAAKYVDSGGSIYCQISADDKSWVRICVSDTGKGIPETMHNQIFERFYRLPKHSKTNIPGSGLGLTLVKELVEINGGQIKVSNNSQGGAQFEIKLPRHIPSNNETQSYPTTSLKTEVAQTKVNITTEHNKNKHTILIIDDTTDMRSYLHSELNQAYNILIAEDGETGLSIIKDREPDLIICDIMMPGIDGFEVLKRLRADMDTSHIPVILLTAKSGKENRIRGYQERADDYITKPFAIDELKARIQGIIDIRITWRKQAQKTMLTNSAEEHSVTQNYQANEQKLLDKFKQMLKENYMNSDLKIEAMSQAMLVSESTLNRKIKAMLGHSPYQYLRIYRLERSAQTIKGGYKGSMADLAEAMGFSTQQHFTSSFKTHFGSSPSDYRNARE